MTKTIDRKELFETMPVKKAVMAMAIPTIISQLINLVYNIVDTFFIGRTGNPLMIAGVTASFPIFLMNISLSNMAGNGSGSLMARLSGQGENNRAKQAAAYGFWLAVISALGYSLILILTLEPLLRLLGASESTMVFAKQYVTFTVIIGNLPTILAATMAHLLRNAGYSKQASLGLSGGGVLNIILDPLFMFVIMPEGKEVMGAAVATLIANTCACIYLLLAYNKMSVSSNLCMKPSMALSIQKQDRDAVYSVGVPSGLLTAFLDVSNVCLNAQIAVYGDFALAALGIVMKVERLPNAICIGLCQGSLPIIAYNFTNGNRKRMQDVIKTTRLYGVMICASCIILMNILARKLVGLFINTKGTDPAGALATISFAVTFLRIRCWQSPLQFMNYQPSFSMQAMGDGKDTFIHAFFRQFLFYIPFMFIFNKIFGIYGLVSAIIAGESCGAILAFILLRKFLGKNAIEDDKINV